MVSLIWVYLLVFSKMTLASVFGLSSVGKLRDLPGFQHTIVSFQILPNETAKFTAYFLCISECFVALLMLFVKPPLLVFAFWLAILLLGAFCVVLWIIIRKGIQISCNCFGPAYKNLSGFDIWRNIGMIFLAVMGLLSISKHTEIQVGIFETGLLGIMAIVLTVLWINLDSILDFIGWDKSLSTRRYIS